MSSKQSTIDFILDQLEEAGDVSAKKMFGEFGIYLGNKMFALVCDDILYFKPTDQASKFLPTPTMASPYPSAKPCILIPPDKLEDREWLGMFAKETARALPAPAKSRKKA